MTLKTEFVLISTIVLLHHALALPAYKWAADEAQTSTNAVSELKEENPFKEFVAQRFGDITNATIREAVDVFDKVAQEAANKTEQTEDTREFVLSLKNYSKGLKCWDKEFVAILMAWMAAYNGSPAKVNTEYPIATNGSFKASLEKHGWKEVKANYERRKGELTQELSIKVQHYLDGLSEDEKAKRSKIVDWYKAYQIETNSEKKMEMILDLNVLFDKLVDGDQ